MRKALVVAAGMTVAAAMTAQAGEMIADYAAWQKLSPAQRSAYAAGFVDGQLVGEGPEHIALFIGVTSCLKTQKIDAAKLAETITRHYEKTPADRAAPPGVAILKQVFRGTCLAAINAERKKYKLPPLGKSDG